MSRRTISAALLLTALLIFSLFTGCSAKKENAEEPFAAWDMSDVKPQYVTELPENEFTEKIVRPQSGEVDYVLDHTDSRHYAVLFKNISSEESERYVRKLKKNGYSEMNSAENTVSVGTILEGEKAYLSVSYSDGVLGVLIALRE